MNDPRADIEHPLNIGQVYSDVRTSELTKVIYLDEDIVLLRDEDKHHRIEKRGGFERSVGSGRYSLTDEDFGYAGRLEAVTDLVSRYESSDGRKGSHKAEAIREVLDLLTEETAQFEEVPFEELDNIGSTAATNLRAAGLTTVEDIRRVSDDELLSIGWVGEAGVESIREYV